MVMHPHTIPALTRRSQFGRNGPSRFGCGPTTRSGQSARSQAPVRQRSCLAPRTAETCNGSARPQFGSSRGECSCLARQNKSLAQRSKSPTQAFC
jgi:hypothetical protein